MESGNNTTTYKHTKHLHKSISGLIRSYTTDKHFGDKIEIVHQMETITFPYMIQVYNEHKHKSVLQLQETDKYGWW